MARLCSYCLFSLLLVAAWGVRAAPETCPADRLDAWATVTHVYDGDTVRLDNDSKVRLIGLDTPELGHDGNPSQPYAVEAHRKLQGLLGPRRRVGLRYDAERYDHHGRRLAHLFLPDGTNVQRALLEAGLATALVFPPNLWQQTCYAGAQTRARAAPRGLWRLHSYSPTDASRLAKNTQGYRVVRGRVGEVGESSKSFWLNLSRRMALRIDKRDLDHFQTYSPRALKGKRVEARGMVRPWRGRLRMRIRHPAALSVID